MARKKMPAAQKSIKFSIGIPPLDVDAIEQWRDAHREEHGVSLSRNQAILALVRKGLG